MAGSAEPLELNSSKDAELILILKDTKLNRTYVVFIFIQVSTLLCCLSFKGNHIKNGKKTSEIDKCIKIIRIRMVQGHNQTD